MASVTISEITKITDEYGKYGPQKHIFLKDSLGRSMGGWVPADKFQAQEWQAGITLDLEVSQKGQYTNFKYKGANQANMLNGAPQQVQAPSNLPNQHLDSVVGKLELLQATMTVLNGKLDMMNQRLVSIEKFTDPNTGA